MQKAGKDHFENDKNAILLESPDEPMIKGNFLAVQARKTEPEFPPPKRGGNFYRKYGKNYLQNGHKRCIIYKWP